MFGYDPGFFSGKKRKKGLPVITILNNTHWLKLRRFFLSFSILAIVWGQNDDGINIEADYVPLAGSDNSNLVHGYFNAHTAITITVTLSGANANGAGDYDLSNKYIKIRFGTRGDNNDFEIEDFDLPNSTYSNTGLLLSESVELLGKTGTTYNDDDSRDDNDDVNSITFTITPANVNFNATGLNDAPTWVDFAIIFHGWNTNPDGIDGNADDFAYKRYNLVNWTDDEGNNEKTSLRWDDRKPYFWLYSWNGSCDGDPV